MHPAVWPQWKWAKNWVGAVLPLFGGVDLSPYLAQCACTEAHLHAKYHLHPPSRLAVLATIDMGRKLAWGAMALFWGGELGPHLAQCGLDRGPPP